jgi:hypothetical protein
MRALYTSAELQGTIPVPGLRGSTEVSAGNHNGVRVR